MLKLETILNCITNGGGIKALTREHQMKFTGQNCLRKRQQLEQEQLIT
jgi:ribosome-associated protein YbcJ (S4-like RNA binding protein)